MYQQPSRPAAWVPGMEHFNRPPRPSWARRHSAALWVTGALAFIGLVTALGFAHSGPSGQTFRDPGSLAKSVKTEVNTELAKENSQVKVTGGFCQQKDGNSYLCLLNLSDGSSRDYPVTVAADGSSWIADPS